MSEEFKTIVWFHRVISTHIATEELGMISFPAQFQLSILLHRCGIPCPSSAGGRGYQRAANATTTARCSIKQLGMLQPCLQASLQCFATLPKEGFDQPTLCFPLLGWDLGKVGCRQLTGQSPIALTCTDISSLCLEPQNSKAPSRNFIHFHLGWQRPLVHQFQLLAQHCHVHQ